MQPVTIFKPPLLFLKTGSRLYFCQMSVIEIDRFLKRFLAERQRIICVVLLVQLVFASTTVSAFQAADTLLLAMQEELAREKTEFAKLANPPYYIDYRLSELKNTFIRASFGSLINSHNSRNRILATRVKVGDYSYDDSHRAEGQSWRSSGGGGSSSPAFIPLDNNMKAIKQALWKATEQEYRQALESYKMALNEQAPGSVRNQLGDFTKESPSVYYEEPAAISMTPDEVKTWENRLKEFSSLFLQRQDIIEADLIFNFTNERKYFVSSEGSSVVQNLTYANVMVSAAIRAADGDVAPLYLSYFAHTPEGLPAESVIRGDIDNMLKKLEQLKNAPLAEPYSGPAILSGASAGVFFHEIFGHRVEGHRLRNDDDSQTFKAQVESRVLPKGFDIYSDPTAKVYEGKSLNGSYTYDDEGVKARKVQVVKDGILKNFLMSRIPLEEFANSNGHGRASAGMTPVSRQSNLLVEESKTVSTADLRKMLIKECRKQGKSYGYLFQEVTGGYTNTDRYTPNAFNVDPVEVYRVYTDGRPDELVRGVALIGTPLSMFAEIEAAGGEKEIFTGICGAESGGVPVSAVAPSVFVRRIETQKKLKLNVQEPLLPIPGSTLPN